MSMPRTVKITCPNCGRESDFVIWDSINTMLDPETKQAVRDESLFKFTCPHCHETTTVNYSFLYHQMEDHMMIHCAMTEENRKDFLEIIHNNKNDLMPGDNAEKYLIRSVLTLNETKEKLQIFDAGLDDRMIELCKYIILSKLIREDNLNPEDTELYYFRDDNKNYVQIIHDHEPYGVTEINDEFYQGMEERFGTGLPDIRKSEEVIDRNWALRSIRAATKN